MLQQLALLKGFDLDGLDPTGSGFHPPADRVREARLRRPRHVLRRSRLRRGADRGAAVRQLQRGAAQARHRQGVAGLSPGLGRGLWRGHQAEARGPARAPPSAPWARASRPSAGSATCAATPCISTSSTGRQHDLGNAVRRLAAVLAGDPGARLLPRQPRADVLARRRPSGRARARTPAAHDAVSPTMALRDGEPYLAWGSPGGDQQDQWITQFFLRHVHCGHEPAGGDRRAGLALRALPDFVLAAHRAARRAGRRKPRAEGDGRRTDAAAATSSRSAPTGRKAA